MTRLVLTLSVLISQISIASSSKIYVIDNEAYWFETFPTLNLEVTQNCFEAIDKSCMALKAIKRIKLKNWHKDLDKDFLCENNEGKQKTGFSQKNKQTSICLFPDLSAYTYKI